VAFDRNTVAQGPGGAIRGLAAGRQHHRGDHRHRCLTRRCEVRGIGAARAWSQRDSLDTDLTGSRDFEASPAPDSGFERPGDHRDRDGAARTSTRSAWSRPELPRGDRIVARFAIEQPLR
jgi:hypothetical protein